MHCATRCIACAKADAAAIVFMAAKLGIVSIMFEHRKNQCDAIRFVNVNMHATLRLL